MNIIVIGEHGSNYEWFEGLFDEVEKAKEYIKKDIEENPYAAEHYSIWRIYKNRPEEGKRLIKSKPANEWAKDLYAIPYCIRFPAPEEADPVDCEEVY